MNERAAILERLMSEPAAPVAIADVEAWWAGHQRVGAGVDAPVHRAILGGFQADRLGYAFASGYCEALSCAIPERAGQKLALCASEEKGAHPRFIETRLKSVDGAMILSGVKHYATLGPHADGYIVIASTGRTDAGQNRLKAVQIPRARTGVSLIELPPTPFVPELPHARIAFDEVVVADDELLPGDGYTDYLKPFRTIEDIHVHAAASAWLLRVGRHSGWPHALLDEYLAVVLTFAGLGIALGPQARTPALAPAVHIALAGAIAQLQRLVAASEPHWTDVAQETVTRWRRDQPLLGIASKARARRREVAWQQIS